MIPCNECLIYAICKNKRKIECRILFNWIIKFKGNGTITKDYLPNWIEISKVKNGVCEDFVYKINNIGDFRRASIDVGYVKLWEDE